MTQLSNDEQRLVDFLRQYRPRAPIEPPDLEAQILEAIASEPTEDSSMKVRHLSARRLWIIPSAIAAAVAIVAIGDRLLMPKSPTPAELASLEAFVETNWDGVVNGSPTLDPTSDWLSPFSYPSESQATPKERVQ